MEAKISEEEAGKVVRALNLKRRIRELEKQIAVLQREKTELEEEYANLGIKVE